ncbi:MAG: bifunctional YncE family protein/alkaline phosphatase family protein [Candidatus Eisenbacteria bacterium]|nr:bifunctional YncE family protein/alkaline phosphatase family protein [Candidatus Eisenbacteria bacterium]
MNTTRSMRANFRRAAWTIALLTLASCGQRAGDPPRLPTGAHLDPAGPSIRLGSMPVAMILSPDSSRIVAVLSGYREQGVQVIDIASRRVVQTLTQPAAFVGATFAPDGRSLYVSGGNRDEIYVYAWRGGAASLADSIVLGRPAAGGGHCYPAGLACSADGARLYVAENLADSLVVIDLATKRVVQRCATGRYPYAVIADGAGRVYVSAWGGAWVATFAAGPRGLVAGPRIAVGRHPSAMTLDRNRSRLYVACASVDRIAVVDTRGDSVVATIDDSAPGAPPEGSTPDGLALSPDARRLYVAEADNNALAVFAADRIAPSRSPVTTALLGRVPVEWYPTAVLTRGDSLWVLNGKGAGTGPNARFGQPGLRGHPDRTLYTLGQTNGSLTPLRAPDDRELPPLASRVAAANGWNRSASLPAAPPFAHVIYIIRENRTYDQVFGDLTEADGDTSLVFFPSAVTPNAHALARRYGIFDRFFVNGEVSGDGHNWSTAAYASDYVEKTIPSNYAKRGRSYDYDGLNRDSLPDDDVNEPGNGYLWDLARRARVTLRNYGEFTRRTADGRWVANKAWLATRTDPEYPGWDLAIPDSVRAARWIAQFQTQVAGDSVPGISILYLPNDHTAGARAHAPTPRAYVADNDLALGRIVEAVTRSRAWASTVILVLEDDAQDGPDHVDSHRSPMLMISPYNRPGVRHRFANTTDVIATIDHLLHLGALSQFDRFGRPLLEVFASTPDTAAYTARVPSVPMHEVNRDSSDVALLSRRLDLSRQDRADPALFNRILWRSIKGPDRPYPNRVATRGPLPWSI